MELRRLSVCIAFFMLAVISQCSEARHSVHRRASDYEVSDEMMNDESRDYGFQNDADGGNEADEEESQPDGVILSKGENYSMIIGMSVRLECRVTPADGSLVVSWNKGDRAIFLGRMPQGDRLERVSLDKHSSDLIIKDLKISDTGLYTCKIMQANPVNITHSVIVEELPIIRNPETTTDTIKYEDYKPRINSFNATSTVLREGDDLFISCDVSGNPEPEVRLTRVTKSGPGSGSAERLVPSDHTFSKKNISKDDAGVYYCYAISGTNSVVKEMTIDVLVKPRVHVARPQVNTDIDMEAQLQCATHEDTAHIRWYKDGQLIEDASTQYTISTNGPQSTLSVTPRRDEDFGTYTCEAENAHSRHSKSIDLIQTPIIENYDVQGPNLSWTVHSHQPLEEIEVLLKPSGEDGEWKSFQVPLPEEKTHVYEIVYPLNDKSLEKGSYMANVKVKNNKGWSQHSEPVEVTLKEDQPQPIQTASVYRDGATDGAHSIRPATFAALSTLMCLLVRML